MIYTDCVMDVVSVQGILYLEKKTHRERESETRAWRRVKHLITSSWRWGRTVDYVKGIVNLPLLFYTRKKTYADIFHSMILFAFTENWNFYFRTEIKWHECVNIIWSMAKIPSLSPFIPKMRWERFLLAFWEIQMYRLFWIIFERNLIIWFLNSEKWL